MRSDNTDAAASSNANGWTQVFHDEDTVTEDSVEENLFRLEEDLRQLSPSVVEAAEASMGRIDECYRDIQRMGTLILPEEGATDDEGETELIRDVDAEPALEIRAWTPSSEDKTSAGEDNQEEATMAETEAPGNETEEEMAILDEEDSVKKSLGSRLKELIQGIVTFLGNCARSVFHCIAFFFDRVKAGASFCFTSLTAGVVLFWNYSCMLARSVKERCSEKATASYEVSHQWATHASESVASIDTKTQTLFGGLFFGLLAATLLAQRPPTLASPTDDLRDFVTFEKTNNVVDLKKIEDLTTEAFRTYARSTCVEAATFEQARDALSLGLYGVPESVRNDLVRMAVIEGVTQKNSVQDSTSDFVEDGKAEAYMAFWSTVYNPRDKQQAYKTCVMVTGVALTVAETIAEWTTKTERYQIGIEPCHCGFVYCEECPVFDTREVQWPIFERRSLSLQKQEDLRRWLTDRAVQSAEHLLLGSSEKEIEDGSGRPAWNPVSGLAWSRNDEFFGKFSHADRVKRTVYPKTTTEQEL